MLLFIQRRSICILEERDYDKVELIRLICGDKDADYYALHHKFAGGKNNKTFKERLDDLCEYEYDSESKTYRILKVHSTPLTMQDKDKYGIEIALAPLLAEMIYYNEDEVKNGQFYRYYIQKAKLINPNFSAVHFHYKEWCKHYGWEEDSYWRYYDFVRSNIHQFLLKTLRYLRKAGYIDFEECYIIEKFRIKKVRVKDRKLFEKERQPVRRADEREIALYNRIVKKIKAELNIKKAKTPYFSSRQSYFQRCLDSQLWVENINSFHKGVQITYISDRITELIKSNSSDFRKDSTCNIKDVLDQKFRKKYSNKVEQFSFEWYTKFIVLSEYIPLSSYMKEVEWDEYTDFPIPKLTNRIEIPDEGGKFIGIE